MINNNITYVNDLSYKRQLKQELFNVDRLVYTELN